MSDDTPLNEGILFVLLRIEGIPTVKTLSKTLRVYWSDMSTIRKGYRQGCRGNGISIPMGISIPTATLGIGRFPLNRRDMSEIKNYVLGKKKRQTIFLDYFLRRTLPLRGVYSRKCLDPNYSQVQMLVT